MDRPHPDQFRKLWITHRIPYTTKLAPNHHLVQAKDLEPWLRIPDSTPPETLQNARNDFGQAILRPDVAEQLGLKQKLPRPEL